MHFALEMNYSVIKKTAWQLLNKYYDTVYFRYYADSFYRRFIKFVRFCERNS